MATPPPSAVRTDRLIIRPVTEQDRQLFVRLFSDAGFMVFSERGALSATEANQRFNHMLELGQKLPFAKQAMIEKVSGEIVGYVGADYFDLHGSKRLEFGYRLIERARGRGYATEAGLALLDVVRKHLHGELLAIVDPGNEPSRKVLGNLGFRHRETLTLMGGDTELWGITL
jgi:RimJ/RimL family protein N-acetyltransferase